MDRRDFAAECPLEWALKDVDLAIGAARGDTPPLLAALSGQWHTAVAAGHGREDAPPAWHLAAQATAAQATRARTPTRHRAYC